MKQTELKMNTKIISFQYFKFLLIFFLLLIFGINELWGQTNTYTLEESLKLGLENSKALKISKAKLSIASSKITEIKSQRLPKLTFNASYVRYSDIPPFEILTPFSPTPIRVQEPILNSYNFKLSLQQPIFTGFKLSSLHSAADYNFESSKLEYSKEINEEAFKIITAFWQIYKAQNANKLLDENLRSLQSHINDSRNFLDNDLITRNDLLKLKCNTQTYS